MNLLDIPIVVLSLFLPLFAIFRYWKKCQFKLTIYIYQLILFYIFYPAVWIVGYIFSPEEYGKKIFIYSLASYTLFTISFIAVYKAASMFTNKNIDSFFKNRVYKLDYKKMYIIFFSLLILGLLIRWYNGILFHIAINPDYNFESGSVENLVKIINSACIIPAILLMVYNVKKGLNIKSFILLMIFILIYIPTGLRSATLIPVVIYIIVGLSYQKINVKLLIIFVVILFATIVVQGNIRVEEKDRSSELKDNVELFLFRMSDLRNTGLMVDLHKKIYNTRYLENLDNYFYCYSPNIIRSFFDISCNTNESTEFTREIGVAPAWSSEPITIIGDSYSRFMIPGIILIGLIFGVLVGLIDALILRMREPFNLVYFILIAQLSFSVYSASILNMLLVMTRDSFLILIFLLIASSVGTFNIKNESHS